MIEQQPDTSGTDIRPRRDFLRAAALGVGAAVSLTGVTAGGAEPASSQPASNPIPLRPFGKHSDIKISALGMGGHHLGDCTTVEDAIALVDEAISSGINFFDNCWEYHNGKSENWLGRALAGKRDKAFVMTKVCTHGRDATLAMQMLEQSLRRLQTDHLDLWQVHGVTFDNDPELAYRKGGVLEALDQAKQQGKVRFTGFTGHKDPTIHLKMIELGYPFDAVQMPLNPFDFSFLSFEQLVLPELLKRGIAPLGMKSMNGTALAIKSDFLKAEDMLRYAMSLPVATTIVGMESPEVLRLNVAVARNFQPMPKDKMDALRSYCADRAADGRFEWYKVSLAYDNPQARLPHHFPLDPNVKEVKDMFKGAMSASPQ